MKKAEKRKRIREKKKRQALVEKLNPGLGNKYSKERALKELEKSSKSGSGVTMLKVRVILRVQIVESLEFRMDQITALMKFNDFTLFCKKYFVSKVLLKNQMDINYKQE